MSDKEIEIFELCERLAALLGSKEAIANLKQLYESHREMFKNMEQVSKVINEVVSEPEIIVDAARSHQETGIYKAAKRLDNDDKKMGDVVIKNENGVNEIFHANRKRMKEFNRLKKRENLLQVETPTLSTHHSNGLELMNKDSSGEKTLSATDPDKTVPQNTEKEANNKINFLKILNQHRSQKIGYKQK